MYNSDLPTRAELPTSKQLLKSTVLASFVAAVLLITAILPAEYGIDPSGIGKQLGLTKMGKIKVSLAKEAEQDAAAPSVPEIVETITVIEKQVATPEVPEVVAIEEPDTAPVKDIQELKLSTDLKIVTLKPGQAAEIKLAMKKGSRVNYQWNVKGGKVNYDTHGDSSSTNYFGYGKGRQVSQDSGILEAAFDGKHGWFWRNRSENDVSISISTEGDYQSFERML